MMKHLFFLALIAMAFFSYQIEVHADAYSCAKMVYKDGWIKQYEYKGNTWGANIKKHGLMMSTTGSSTETSTASVDPGVTTGHGMSTMQYSSSWGECSMLEMYITRQFRDEYIEQNMEELKKQIAYGHGHHIDSLAFLSGCSDIHQTVWQESLQFHTETFYNTEQAKDFSKHLNSIIQGQPSLKKNCQYNS